MSKFPYPENPAKTDVSLLDAIKRRWSPVSFSDEPIEQVKIDSLFEALRWTQSAYNEQPWRVIYATADDKENFNLLSSVLDGGNSWAKNTYLLIMICALPNHEYENKPNLTYQYDTGAAVHSMFLQAVSMNLVAHEMSGFDQDKAYEKLDIPRDVSLMAMIAIGYPGDDSKLSDDLKERQQVGKRERKEISDIVFKGKWK